MDYVISPLTTAERWSAVEDLFGRAASHGVPVRVLARPPDHDRRADNKRDLRRLAASGRSPGLPTLTASWRPGGASWPRELRCGA